MAHRDGGRYATYRLLRDQGFCCACSFAQVIGVDQSSTRAGLNCAVISGQSSAHCLRRSDLWYSVFGIGPVETSFDIVVTLYQQTATGLACLPPLS